MWRGDDVVSDKEKYIMDKFQDTIPKLEEIDKMYLLGLVEGMSLAKSKVVKEEVPIEELINT